MYVVYTGHHTKPSVMGTHRIQGAFAVDFHVKTSLTFYVLMEPFSPHLILPRGCQALLIKNSMYSWYSLKIVCCRRAKGDSSKFALQHRNLLDYMKPECSPRE